MLVQARCGWRVAADRILLFVFGQSCKYNTTEIVECSNELNIRLKIKEIEEELKRNDRWTILRGY